MNPAQRNPLPDARACGWKLAACLALSALPGWSREVEAATDPPYPRVALYSHVYGDGYPMLRSDGTLSDSALDAHARYPQVVFEASPATEHRPDIISSLLARNPQLSLLAYIPGHFAYSNPAVDTLIDFPYRYWQTVRDRDGFLYNRQGQLFWLCNVNLAKRNAQGRYVVAEALADLIHGDVISTGLWNGLFFDVYCEDPTWMQTPTDSFDFQRAGYSTFPAFIQGFREGHNALGNRLRSLTGNPDFALVGNCGTTQTLYASFNGWMRENFPFQMGGSWYENMFRTVGGYFHDEASFRVPRHNYIFTAAEPPDQPYSSTNRRKVRFGLGSAALGGGYACFGYSDRQTRAYPYYLWWYDEYAVDRTTGQGSTSPSHTGYLGYPLGSYYQMVWTTPGPDGVSNPDFETDLGGWSFTHFVPASLSRESGAAPSGSWSARVNVAAAGPFDYYVSFASQATLSLVWNRQYAVTFWARASAPRRIGVVLVPAAGGSAYAARLVDVDSQWKRYQVVFDPLVSANARVQLQFGDVAGDVWVDDVHFQEGASSLFRRDFQNGIVLVNPANTPMTAPLERPYRKILGSVSPEVNDGSTVTSVTIGPSDALFLLGDDIVPPAPVNNLRRVP
jgi:hypothetical protein